MKENGFINEFKKFIMRGNVMDMAVGVIVGGAHANSCRTVFGIDRFD